MSSSPTVVIVGSGFGGIAAAIALTRAGIRDITILERATELGGVWRENTYPGAACDVPRRCTRIPSSRTRVVPPLLTDSPRSTSTSSAPPRSTASTSSSATTSRSPRAEFDEAARHLAHPHRPRRGPIEADVFVPAVGQLSRPALPAIPGIVHLRGARVPFRPVGSRGRVAGCAGGGHRHGRERDPVHPADRAGRRRPARSSNARRRISRRRSTASTARPHPLASQARVPATSAAGPRIHLVVLRMVHARPDQVRPDREAPAMRCTHQAEPRRSTIRCCAPSSSRTIRSAANECSSPTITCRH